MMQPVHCRTRHDPPHSYGDCVRACVASLLELPPEDVPHVYHDNCDGPEGMRRMREWLRERGYGLFASNYDGVPLSEMLSFMGELNPDVHYMLFGGTGDGGDHVVICHGDKIVHNPAWYGCSLVGPASTGYWQIGAHV